jgi:hypothetical protein
MLAHDISAITAPVIVRSGIVVTTAATAAGHYYAVGQRSTANANIRCTAGTTAISITGTAAIIAGRSTQARSAVTTLATYINIKHLARCHGQRTYCPATIPTTRIVIISITAFRSLGVYIYRIDTTLNGISLHGPGVR